jgi:hypothetical protein
MNRAARRLTVGMMIFSVIAVAAWAQDQPPADDDKPVDRGRYKYDALEEEQINLVKLYELPEDLSSLGRSFRIQMDRKDVQEFFTRYAERDEVPKGFEEQRKFYQLEDWRKLQIIFSVQAREMYPKIKLRQDPPALMTFRRRIHRNFVVSYCATANCHGNAEAPGGLYLFPDSRNEDKYVYTNFYILSQANKANAFMIDRNEPGKSLLIQYGLDRRAASTPHPEVKGWSPKHTGLDDKRLDPVLDWMRELYPKQADYGIDYEIPGKKKDDKEEEGEETEKPAEAEAVEGNEG